MRHTTNEHRFTFPHLTHTFTHTHTHPHTKQIIGNEEISNVIKILGLQYSKKYADTAELKSLRYGKLMIMADQDQDGSHIKGLVINFIHHNWPNLIKHSFVEEFITPIVKVRVVPAFIIKFSQGLSIIMYTYVKEYVSALMQYSCVN